MSDFFQDKVQYINVVAVQITPWLRYTVVLSASCIYWMENLSANALPGMWCLTVADCKEQTNPNPQLLKANRFKMA